MQSATSLTLLARLCSEDRGDREQAWDRFVNIYTPLLMHWASKQGFQQSDAADLTQEVLLKLISRLREYERRQGGSFRAWLMTLLRNQGTDYRRRKATRRLDVGDVGDFSDRGCDDPLLDLEEAEYNRWVITRGLELIREDFSEETWKAFRGLMFDGKSAADLAIELGVSANSIYLSRHRILARLREELEGFIEET